MSRPTPSGARRGDLIAIFVAALLLRLAVLATSAGDPVYEIPMLDAEYAVEWAAQIRAGDLWGSPEGTAYFRTPLYSWFLALAFALPGPDLLVARLLQAILGAAAAALLADLAVRCFSRGAGWVAGILAATAWPLLLFGRELLIVSIAFFLGVLVLRSLDSAWRAPSRGRWLATGAWIGLAALARPNFLLLAPVSAVLAALAHRSDRAGRALLLLAGALVVLSPVTIRNRVVSGEWIPVSYQAGINLWIGNNPEADGMSARLPGFSSWRNEDVDAWLARELGHRPTPGEQDAHFRGLALEYAGESPAAFISGVARKTYLFLQGYEIRNNRDLYALRERHPFLGWLLPDWGWILPLAIVGLVAHARRLRELAPLWVYGATMAAGPILFFVCARYRVPAWPAFVVLAGAGGVAILERSAGVRTRVVRVALLVALVLAARIDVLDVREPDRSQVHFQYGNVYARAGLDEEAEREFRTAISIAPGLGEARWHLGALFLRQGRLGEAHSELAAAARRLPRSFGARRSLAETLEAAGQTDSAVRVRREIVELTAGAPEDLAALATSLGMNGQYEEAYRIFDSLAGTDLIHDPFFLLNAGQTALMLKKEGPGTEWLRTASRFPGFTEDAYVALARYQLSYPRFDEGLRVLSEGLLRAPDSIPLLHLRARARRATGDESGAIEDWQHVLRLAPDDDAAREAIDHPPRREP